MNFDGKCKEVAYVSANVRFWSCFALGGKEDGDHLRCMLHGEGRAQTRLSLGAELKKVLWKGNPFLQ